MNKNILYSDNFNFFTTLKFKIPINASINDIKIINVRLFSKILTKGNIAIYGNYETIIFYNFHLRNNKFQNRSIRKKINFYKVINLRTFLEHKNLSNIKINIGLSNSAKCFYSIYNNKKSGCPFKITNFCKTYILFPLSISLVKESIIETKLIKKNNKTLNKGLSFIKADKKTRYIDAHTIIGTGSIDFFIEKNISISSDSPPFWIVDNVQVDVGVNKLTLIGEKLIASGNINVNITYKTLIYSIDNASSGSLRYLQTFIPFSSEIKIKTHDNSNLKESDEFKVTLAKCLGEKHILNDSTLRSSGEILYNTINEQLIIQIKVIATRKEKIFI